MRKYCLLFAVAISMIALTGCGTGIIHDSKDMDWYVQQVEKEKQDPNKTLHNCPYCRCLKTPRSVLGTDIQK